MQTNAELTREYFNIMDSLEGDIQGRRDARAYMDRSTAIVHHQWTPPSCPACSTSAHTTP